MPRRTCRYALDTFLRQLARTGNFALAADLAGLAKSGLSPEPPSIREGLRSNRELTSKTG